jgi:hypothetical protein
MAMTGRSTQIAADEAAIDEAATDATVKAAKESCERYAEELIKLSTPHYAIKRRAKSDRQAAIKNGCGEVLCHSRFASSMTLTDCQQQV